MSQRRLNDGNEGGSVSIAPYEYAAVYEYLGKNRYLRASFCKAVAKLYSDKFGMYTTKALLNIAAEEGFIEVLEWSLGIGCRFDDSLFVSGAKGGHVDILKFLREQCGCPMPHSQGSSAWIAAAERGHLEVLKFARDSKYLQDRRYPCGVAARNGHLHILKWIYEVEGNMHFDADTCKQAAMGGFIEIVQWLRSVGCAWDGEACDAAIRKGHVGILKWALDNGCPWDANDRTHSRYPGLHCAKNAEVIEFLISRGANINEVDRDGQTALRTKVLQGDIKSVKTLIRLGADVNIADKAGMTPLAIAIKRRNHEIAELLRAAGAREST